MKPLRHMVYGLLIGLLAAGSIFLVSQQDLGTPITLNPAPSPTPTLPPQPTRTLIPIQVQIGGMVVNAGIYALQKDSRLVDLVELAGGLTEQGDMDRVNFAALLRDGDYFYIPALGEPIPDTARNSPTNSNLESAAKFDYPLNLNEANQEALESLPDIGPTKAIAILAYRDEIGGFTSVDELLNVPGIGPAILESLREYVIIEP